MTTRRPRPAPGYTHEQLVAVFGWIRRAPEDLLPCPVCHAGPAPGVCRWLACPAQLPEAPDPADERAARAWREPEV